jgi:hypothetical protein
LGLIFGLLPAASAQATDRYVDAVASDGDANVGCTVAPPADGCTLDNGINAAGPGDRVFMAAGTYAYSPGNGVLISDANLELIGAGSPQTTITTTATGIASVFINAAGVKVSGLRIVDSSGNGNAIQLGGAGTGGVIERVSAITSGFSACLTQANGMTTIRDSVCAKVGAGVGNPAIQVSSGAAQQLVLTNVTGYAGNTNGVALLGFAGINQDTTITVRNSILNAPTGTDVFVNRATVGHTIDVNADYSSYATVGPLEAEETVTPAGSLNNIVAPALFADTDTNFHQAAGYLSSPTIDKGSAAATTSTLDIDGGARTVGSAPDIGADEFVPAPPVTPTPPGPTAAATTGQRAAALKKCKKKKGPARKKCKKKALKLPV